MRTILALLLLVSCAAAQECVPVEDATNLHLYAELAQRGISSFGCWAPTRVLVTWDVPESGGQALWYVLEIEGRGFLIDLDIRFNRVYADSVMTYWPENVDTLTARVAAIGVGGQGEWTEPVVEILN